MEQNLLNNNKITFNNEENPNTLPLSEEEFNKIQNKKWDEKCDYINNLIEFISTHNSIEIDYNLLSLYIKYFLSFPNLKVNSTCLDFLISLTPILNTNENYKILISDILPSIVEKFKEKKERLNDQINILLTIILKNTLDLTLFLNSIKSFINDKSIIYKNSIAEFIFINLRKTYYYDLEKATNIIIEIFGTCIQESNIELKNCSMSSLSLLRKRVGRKRFDLCEERKKINDDLLFEIEQVMENINYDRKYDEGRPELEDENEEYEFEEIEEEIEEEVEESISHKNSIRKSIKKSLAKQNNENDKNKNIINNNNNDNMSNISNLKSNFIKSMDSINSEIESTKNDNINKLNNDNRNEDFEDIIEDKPVPFIRYSIDKNEMGVIESKNNEIDKVNSENENNICNEQTKNIFNNNSIESKNSKKEENKNEIYEKKNSPHKDLQIKENKPEEENIINSNEKEKEIILKEDLIQTLKETEEEKPLELGAKIQEKKNENYLINNNNKNSSLNEFEKKLAEAIKNEEINQLNQYPKEENQIILPKKKKSQEEIEITEKIKNFILDNNLFILFDSNKWDEKKKAFIKLNEILTENLNSYSNENKEIIFNFIRLKLNNFKESNFNILKEAYSCFIILFSSNLEKKYVDILIKGIYEKLSDVKLKEIISKLMITLIETYGTKMILNQLLLLFDKKSKIILMKEYCILFDKIIEDYGTDNIDLKLIIDFCVNLANNSNPQARVASSQLICTLYKYIGNDIKILIKGIKESTLKNIEQEIEKIQVLDKKDIKPKKVIKIENNNNINKDLVPTVDISKQITNKLLKDIENGKWNDKKEGIELIQKIITNANNKILVNGLNNLFNLIKIKLGDGNKNLVRLIVQLLTQLIQAIGNPIKLYSKLLLLSLLSNLADKQLSLREDCQICIDKWINECGFETIANYIPQLLKTENFELRSELIQILKKHNNKITKDFSENFFKEIMNSYLLCLQDKSSSIRSSIEELIGESLKFIPCNLYYKEIKEFKPAIADSLTLIMDKICIEKGVDNSLEEINNNTFSCQNINQSKSSSKSNNIIYNNNNKIIAKKLPPKMQIRKKSILRENNSKSPNKKTSVSMIMNKSQNDESNGNIKKISNIKSNSRIKTNLRLENGSSILKKKIEKSPSKKKLGSSSVIIKTNRKLSNDQIKNTYDNKNIFLSHYKLNKGAKEKRIEIDKKNRFCLENLIFDYIHKLKEQFKYIFTQEQISKMYSDDIKTINLSLEKIKKALNDNNNQEKVIENLDLILKFCGWKLMQIQTPSLVKAFYELSEEIFKIYEMKNYTFETTESNIFLNIFCEKLTSPNNLFKDNASYYISIIANNIGKQKAFIQLLYICIPKNLKLKIEIIEQINILYSSGEIDNNYLSKAAKPIIKIYTEGDKYVRNRIIPLIKEIFKVIADDIWRYTGDLSEKERDNLYDQLGDECEEEDESEDFNNDDFNDNNEKDLPTFKNNISNISNNDNLSYISSDKNNKFFGEKNENKNKKEVYSPIIDNYNSKKELSTPTKIKEIKYENISNSKNNNSSNKNINAKNNEQIIFIYNNKTNKNECLSFDTLKNSLISLTIPSGDNITNIILTIHEIIFKNFEINKDILSKNGDLIFISFINSINKCFQLQPLPIKIIKYITNVLCKLSGIQELISKISFDIHKKLIGLVLSSVLYDNLNTLGEKNEGMIIWKTFNSIMLRIIDFCNPTDTISIFIEEEKINRISNQKLAEYSARCLVKITQNIKVIYQKMDIAKILRNIHEILIDYEKVQPDLLIKTQTDQMIIVSLRNLLNELVRTKKDDIIIDYNKGVENHNIKDKYIKKWIKNELDIINCSLPKSNSTNNNLRNLPIKVNQSPSINDFSDDDKKKLYIEEMLKNKLKEKKIQIDNLNKSPSPLRENIQIITSPDISKNEKLNALKEKMNNYNSLNSTGDQVKVNILSNNYCVTNNFINSNDNYNNNKLKSFNQIQKKWKDVLSRTKNGRKNEDN